VSIQAQPRVHCSLAVRQHSSRALLRGNLGRLLPGLAAALSDKGNAHLTSTQHTTLQKPDGQTDKLTATCDRLHAFERIIDADLTVDVPADTVKAQCMRVSNYSAHAWRTACAVCCAAHYRSRVSSSHTLTRRQDWNLQLMQPSLFTAQRSIGNRHAATHQMAARILRASAPMARRPSSGLDDSASALTRALPTITPSAPQAMSCRAWVRTDTCQQALERAAAQGGKVPS